MKNKNDFGLIFWIHLILIVLVYTSPFLFNWRLMILFVFLYYLQIIIFNGCILTEKQFGKREYMTFYHYYFTKLGLKINKRFLYYLMRWIMPLIILSVSLVLRLLNYNPLIL